MTKECWWGEFSVEQCQQLRWTSGLRAIAVQRMPSEWIICNQETEEELSLPLTFSQGIFDNRLDRVGGDKLSVKRLLQNPTSPRIGVLPALADRPVVARPAAPLHVFPGESVRIYISTPIWFTVFTLPAHFPMFDAPFNRPSDSWFGPSTLEGEMCYAKYTDAHLNLDAVEPRQYRAITPIRLINKHKELLVIERISVPMPLLGLYVDEQSQLWTDTLTLTREGDRDTATLEFGKESPIDGVSLPLVNKPRLAVEKTTLIRSISSLFA